MTSWYDSENGRAHVDISIEVKCLRTFPTANLRYSRTGSRDNRVLEHGGVKCSPGYFGQLHWARILILVECSSSERHLPSAFPSANHSESISDVDNEAFLHIVFHRWDLGVHDSGCQPSPGLTALSHGFSGFLVFVSGTGSGWAVGSAGDGAFCVEVALSGFVFSVVWLFCGVGFGCCVWGLSRKDGLLAQRSSASRARFFILAWRMRSCCCSWMVGGSSRRYRSH